MFTLRTNNKAPSSLLRYLVFPTAHLLIISLVMNLLCVMCRLYCSVNTVCWTNVGSMLGQRRRRWPNIDPTLVQHLMFTGTSVIVAWEISRISTRSLCLCPTRSSCLVVTPRMTGAAIDYRLGCVITKRIVAVHCINSTSHRDNRRQEKTYFNRLISTLPPLYANTCR